MLAAGGRWDRLERRFLDEPPVQAKIIDLEESQVEFTRWFASFLSDLREGRPRDISLALAAGDRRAGKTFGLLMSTVALLIDVPTIERSSTIGWVVSASYQERDEIDKAIQEFIPSSWYIPKGPAVLVHVPPRPDPQKRQRRRPRDAAPRPGRRGVLQRMPEAAAGGAGQRHLRRR